MMPPRYTPLDRLAWRALRRVGLTKSGPHDRTRPHPTAQRTERLDGRTPPLLLFNCTTKGSLFYYC